MSNIAAGNVTYTVKTVRRMSDSRNLNRIQLAFGDGTLTYPAGGVPLTIGNLGCPTVVESLIVVDDGGSGYDLQFDSTNKKLRMYAGAPHTHDLLFLGGLTVSENVTIDASVKLGKNAATNRTLAGANSATTGGVVSTTPGNQTEATGVAVAAQTIIVEVIGY